MDKLADIIEQVREGDVDAYGLIVNEHQQMLINHVSFRLPDPNLVREVVHKTFIKAYEQLDEFDTSKDFAVWLRVIARYEVMTEIKRHIRERERKDELKEEIRDYLLDSALGQEKEDADYLAMDALRRCLGDLNGHAEKLVKLRYRQRKTSKEIADQLGRTTTWVTTTLHRVRGNLKKCIEEKIAAEVQK